MLVKSFFAGFGGQGVLLMGYALAYGGMLENKNVTFLPAYGAEVRGGTAHCTVAISDDEIASPIASSPEFVVVMNTPSLISFQNQVQSGGQLFLNSSLISQRPIRGDIEIFEVPASRLAEDSGNIRFANMIMLGAFVKKTKLILMKTLLDNLGSILTRVKKDLIKANKTALLQGYEYLK
ncbi:MAG: 2-oxoacid:acceptor oxidoreductase family protein [Deltaproteobacteria bacterium]|nr:MAG: 2-oxoacid:acceptor oxidoreductase family protein [Deltaproteobacteria bacterium]